MKKNKVNYYEMFVGQAGSSLKAADTLVCCLESFDPFTLPEKVEEIHVVENEADRDKRTIIALLLKEFLPPIEREDIMLLADEIDNVTDSVEDVLRHVFMYNVSSIKTAAIDFVKIVREMCGVLVEALEEFKDFRKSRRLPELLVKINELEEHGDQLFASAMRELYVETVDAKELLIWTNIYTIIENCCDTCEHAADIIESVMMKNS